MSSYNPTNINLIFACTFDGGIGYGNRLPWNIPSEMRKFRNITKITKDPTKQNAVIMGRNTWESIEKPLKDRLNIVLTTKNNYVIDDANVFVANNLYDAINHCKTDDNIEEIFIIGGEKLYRNIFFNNNYTIKSIIMSVMFYDKYFIDSYIDMRYIYGNFDIKKDDRFSLECQERLFASFICTPKILRQPKLIP